MEIHTSRGICKNIDKLPANDKNKGNALLSGGQSLLVSMAKGKEKSSTVGRFFPVGLGMRAQSASLLSPQTHQSGPGSRFSVAHILTLVEKQKQKEPKVP